MSADDIAADPATLLDVLFPAAVRTAFSLCVPASAELTPGERDAAGRFTPLRREEFRHGRFCARCALARLGVESVEIPIGNHREPVWPAGVTGSITHAGAVAAAAVARQSHIRSLGLDLEPDAALERELIPRICRPAEIDRELARSSRPGETAKLIFGIKEATYKALWPVTREFLDFHDLEVQLVPEQSQFSVLSCTAACPPALMRGIEGRYTRIEGLFAAGVTLRAIDAVAPAI